MARGRRWTEYEDLWLRQVWPKTEIPAKAIAHTLKRTVSAIQHRAFRLKIGRPWYGSPEHKKISERAMKKSQETWVGSSGHMEHLKRLHETYLGSPEHEKQLKHLHETYLGSTKYKEHLKRLQETWVGSPENLEQLNLARKKSQARPTWPEAIFYGLVYGHDGLSKEFHAQECIPTNICNHTVDGRWKDVIFELDGGGHNVFKDRTGHDRLVDAEYQAMGYRVIREETASNLFLRLLQLVE